MHRLSTWLFNRQQEPRSLLNVIWWWECRRIPYNLIVGLVGVISLLLFFLFIHLSGELKHGEDAVESMALLATPILINIAYTFGWIAEAFLRIFCRSKSVATGPVLLKVGLTVSLLLVMLPSAIWFVIWMGIVVF